MRFGTTVTVTVIALAVAVACLAGPAAAQSKQAMVDEMIAIFNQMQALRGTPGAGPQLAQLQARYDELRAATGGAQLALNPNVGPVGPRVFGGDCAGGEIYDDGTAENGYSGNPASVSSFEGVQQFTPAAFPGTYDTVCVGLVSDGGPTLDFEIEVRDDDGAAGAPGTLLGALPVSAAGIPGLPCAFYSYDITSLALNIPSGNVWIGVRWSPMLFPSRFICSDESPATPLHPGFVNFNLGSGWQATQTVFPGYRAKLIRAIPGAVGPTDADLSITKTGIVNGDQIVYTIAVTNNGPHNATGVVVTDTLDPCTSFVSDDCGAMNLPPWTWDVGSLANGASATCNVVVDASGCPGGPLSNTASASGNENDPTPANNAATTVVGGAVLEAQSGIGRMDPTPAATLLLPYFEVDLGQPSGLTTIFTVNNATAAPVLAHLTLWTDWSIPTVAFDLYLTGFDVQSFNVRDMFTTGLLPQTSPTLSNQGPLSFPNTTPTGCGGNLPVGNLPPILIQLIQQAHTGEPVTSFGGLCGGQNYGDDRARGFITIDVVQQCSDLDPSAPGYFAGVAGSDNVLWGDWFLIDPAAGRALGETLVHLEADPAAFEPGDPSFYGRYVGFAATDGREPLATSWAAPFVDGGAFAAATDLVVWRNPEVDVQPKVCGTGLPFPLPLGAERVIAFDEEENPEEPGIARLAFPLATQRVPVGQAAFPVTAPAGWTYLGLDNAVAGVPVGGGAQSWVATLIEGTALDVARHALPLDNALLPGPLETIEIFRDGFESGDLSAWTNPPPATPSDAVLAAQSGIGRMDPTPAATLLLPYFEVDLDNQPGGLTTYFTVRNAAAEPVLAHLTMWTDWSIGTLDFDIYLTGFDVQAINIADFFTTGTLPQTSPMLSNQGTLSFPNTTPLACAGNLPIGNLLPIHIELITEAHTGQPVIPIFSGKCAGEDYGDNHARGFITLDGVRACSTLFPSSPGYFDPVNGVAASDNVLWGDWLLVDPAAGTAQGASLVHLEADPNLFEPGDYSFYGRYVGFTALDGREPLPTSWATRYLDGGVFAGATDLIVWRDPRTDPDPVVCGGQPFPFPLAAERVIAFDEEENPEEPGAALSAFPLATQRVPVGQGALPVTEPFGWLYLDLDSTVPSPPVGTTAQSWVTLLVETATGIDFGHHALPLDNALLPQPLPTARPGFGASE